MRRSQSDNVLTGVAGEYLVAGELSKRGCIASITLRNTRGIDILASNREASRSVGIQVKATRHDAPYWLMNKKSEKYYAKHLFYVFINLKDDNHRPDFYIVPSKVVADYITKSHSNWLRRPNRKGKKHKDTALRKFSDKDKRYLENWECLNL